MKIITQSLRLRRNFLVFASLASSVLALANRTGFADIDHLQVTEIFDNLGCSDSYESGQTFGAVDPFVAGVQLYIGDPTRPSDQGVNALSGPSLLCLYDATDLLAPRLLASAVIPPSQAPEGVLRTFALQNPVAVTVGRRYFVSITAADCFGVALRSYFLSTYSGGSEAFRSLPSGEITEHPNGRDLSFRIFTARNGVSATPLQGYLYDGAKGPHALKDMVRINNSSAFVLATTSPGTRCIVSCATHLLAPWSSLVDFDVTAVGTTIAEPPTYDRQKLYRATVLPAGVLPAYDFDYPIGNRGYNADGRPVTPDGIPEQITPENNNQYPDHPIANPIREALSPQAGWYNAQDVGAYYSAEGGLHPGEDWNQGTFSDDIGQPVYAVANGQVTHIRPASASGPSAAGYAMVIRHWLLNGNSVDSLYVHIAPDKIDGRINTSGTVGDTSNFSYREGTAVRKGINIGVIGDVSSLPPHLHFELRDKPIDPARPLWPCSIGNAYYGPIPGPDGNRKPTIKREDVRDAFSLMRSDGILDPSDFIDAHRPDQN